MQIFINIANDLIIILGNLIIFSSLLNFKEQKKLNKIVISMVCIALMVAYSICVYVLDIAYIHASILCFTIPSLILFWGFSKIKDARFFLTFCFVDTVSLIIAFITKLLSFYNETYAPYITFAVNLVLYAFIIISGRKFFAKYAKLLQFQESGWFAMMLASFVIYFALYFFAAYPTPMKERLEYAPVYIVFCIVVLSCYTVFIDSMMKTKKLHDQFKELEKEKHFHKIAYKDSLTGLYNRVYYVEKINEIERNCENYKNICCIVMDINNFKGINDSFGHHVGDLVLQDTANSIYSLFDDLSSYIFRIGGDEFFLLILDADEEEVRRKLASINEIISHNDKLQDKTLSIACGYSFIDVQNDCPRPTIEQNFMRADKNMYEDKNEFKRKLKIGEGSFETSYDKFSY